MYHIFETIKLINLMPEWSGFVGDFNQIKGYTEFGEVFLINQKTNEIAILFPLKKNLMGMGYTDWSVFNKQVLQNPGFQEDVVNIKFLGIVKQKVGELGGNQVYYPVPYPFLGGFDAPDTYDKDDVWVFLSIVAQSWGI